MDVILWNEWGVGEFFIPSLSFLPVPSRGQALTHA